MPWGVEDNEPELIQKEVSDLGVRCEKLELDLTSDNAVELLLDTVKKEIGSPSILINNATYSTSTSIDNITAIELDKYYCLNIKATTLLTAQFIKDFKFQTGGRIINMTSGQSLGQMPNELAYAITKSAIESLTYTLSSEIAKKGITINAVNLSPTDTGWMDEPITECYSNTFP